MIKNSIEEDIKILENWLKELNELFKNTHINNTKERKALEHILSDYKRVLKENEELEEINNKLEAEKNEAIRRYNFETIPIKKVKDKIEELNQYYKKEIYPSLLQWRDLTITEHYDEMIELLHEIIGDK